MKKGVEPHLGIDTDARWRGFSHTTKDGYSDINYTWYQGPVLSLYLYLQDITTANSTR